jgi:hypothetical protein
MDHPFQEKVLSHEKLELGYSESRLIVGHVPNTRRMVVELSPRRREKVLNYISQEGWLKPKKKASIQDIATLYGLLMSAAEYFPWAKAQLCILQDLLRACIQAGHVRACTLRRIHKANNTLDHKRHHQEMPPQLQKRFEVLQCREQAQLIWRSRILISIDDNVKGSVRLIYKYMKSNAPWEQLIGHIVPREPALEASSDASTQGIGVKIPGTKTICLMPLSDETIRRTQLPSDDRHYIHINALEFVGVMVTYIIATIQVTDEPSQYPPAPVLHSLCDNISAIAWCRKVSSKSAVGQNLVKLFAEFLLDSPLGLYTSHIPGEENVDPDLLSRPCELHSPLLKLPSEKTFKQHVIQVVKAQREFASWTIFLPSPELLLALYSTLSTDVRWSRPTKPKSLGQFVPVGRILSGSHSRWVSTTAFSL